MKELREESKEFVLDTLRSTSDKLTIRVEALEALIFDLNEKEAFYWFEDGLEMWAKQELHRLGITNLTVAMVEAKNFYDVGERKFDNSKSSKPKPRPKGNGEGDKDQVEKNGKGPRASQGRPWDKKGPM
ncbi:hypothetical protein PVK06_009218 [Gossypium arboreum]|uniref:Uncharacterized protein n=1 Tax=Gossypium arboreum TaxID=29729 RepID=A0ABR0QLY0_GOSAR|nr:hypothetical protein PVK06_009218 [Gossypium arboreum]